MKYLKNIGIIGLFQISFFVLTLIIIYIITQDIANIDGVELFSKEGLKNYYFGYWIFLGVLTYTLLRITVLVDTHKDKFLIRYDLIILVTILFPLGIYILIKEIERIINENNIE